MSPPVELASRTPALWVGRVEREPLALLADHAHCELGAAASAQALVSRNPEKAELVEALAAVALEEMQHFGIVVRELHARGGSLGRAAPNPYAEGLLAGAAQGRRSVLLDRLLVSHLIEARSLERFQLLAEHLRDADLARLYRGLAPSEAAHRALFLRLARAYFDAPRVRSRLFELRALEARLLDGLPFCARVHSGTRAVP